ncbi:hypothetical protein QTG54_005345 [Skeletonema marinoi]|uniref:Uncharacterized protein n=1 Tax=Skeletonema marinoi TaxID=267567 RepID=A0AAD8YDE5_9STRA|nr:hypothetical protein QTG54_005345 [Skeletonema marinoi]
MDFAHDSALRCVHFPPGGDTIIIGGVNPQSYNEGLPNARRERGGMQGGGMSFHLRLWDFSLDAVLNPCTEHRPTLLEVDGVVLRWEVAYRMRVI